VTHGDDDTHPDDEAREVTPDHGVREPDPGSVTSAEADSSGEAADAAHDRRLLEDRRQGPDRSLGQYGQDGQGSRSLELGALEALQVQLESKWQGPMPPPRILAEYDQVQAGLAERIVSMAETVTTGSIKTQDKLADAEIERARTGQALAFLLTVVALGASIWFFAVHDPIAGGAFLSFPVIMLIRSFLPGRDQPPPPGRDDPPPASS
jgi:uncharacterized membrane protein